MKPAVAAFALAAGLLVFAPGLRPPAAPPAHPAPLDPRVTIRLSGGAYLHLLPLPLGRTSALITGDARFDATGTRAVFLATFVGAAVDGDWRVINPTQAFLLDAAAGVLTQLTADGHALAVRWGGADRIVLEDGGSQRMVGVGRPIRANKFARLHLRLVSEAAESSVLVNPPDLERIVVYHNADGSYAIEQVGARVFKVAGVAANGAFAVVGSNLAWIDRSREPRQFIARRGPDNANVPEFAGSAYGDAWQPVMPLGRPVYQGAYRNATAYFVLSYGVRRVLAATSDLVNYVFPEVPHEVVYTTGDGLGAGADGAFYFAWPEGRIVQFWKNGRYFRLPLRMPQDISDERPLLAAMARLRKSARINSRDYANARINSRDYINPTAWLAMRPDQDALDSALLEWRIYPLGDETGPAWIASYLGRVVISDAAGRFVRAPAPAFPFAVLGRTDDGRIWGAAPGPRAIQGLLVTQTTSTLWSTRDGSRWQLEARLDGDAGAVGMAHRIAWVALTRTWLGRAMIAVARLDGPRPASAITGGSYAGEQLFFASVRSGFYLIWGATPGFRLAGEQGTLSAFAIDGRRLFDFDRDGLNAYMRERIDPAADRSLPPANFQSAGGREIFESTLRALSGPNDFPYATLETNVSPASAMPASLTVVTADQELAREVKYAERPYPLAIVEARFADRSALIRRALFEGPLAGSGATESWTPDAGGVWRLRKVLATWEY